MTAESFESKGFETRAIHAGQAPDPVTGAVVPPVSFSTTFVQEAPGENRGYLYSRNGNPTRRALEACLASLEGAAHGFAFASGLAAEDAVLRVVGPGGHVIIPADAYGGTFRLVDQVWGSMGLAYTEVDLTSPDAVADALRPETRLVWVESPSNPSLSIVDIAAVAAITRARDIGLVVDNTFASPYLQQPLALGADIVVHSSTKYIGGHSDVVGGFVATNGGEARLRAEGRGRRAGAVRLLPAAARSEDARSPDGPSLCQCLGRRRASPPTRSWSPFSTRAFAAIRATSWPRGRCGPSAESSRSS